MVPALLVTGTNLNTPMTTDLGKAVNVYSQEVKDSAIVSKIGDIISFVKDTIVVSVEALYKALTGAIDFTLGLIGSVKDSILGFISGLIGRDIGGMSKLSLFEKSNVSSATSSSSDNCSIGDINFGFEGMDGSVLGYGLAALLGMLLCKGISTVFSLLGTIVDLGIATVEVVSGALSDTFKGIFGGNSIPIINDLAASPFGSSISQNVTNSEGMILNSIKNNSSPTLSNANTEYSTLSKSLNTLTPSWLNDGGSFSLSKISTNIPLSNLASKSLASTSTTPTLGSTDYTSKVLNDTEKVSLVSYLNNGKSDLSNYLS